MKRELSDKEEVLTELIHFLATKGYMSVRSIKKFLITPIPSKNNNTPLDLVEKDGLEFLNELKIFVNASQD